MSCNIVIEYFLKTPDENNEEKRTIAFDMEGFVVDELDTIEEFYNMLLIDRLHKLKSFYIFNTNKKYELTPENENELFSVLYYMVDAERRMCRMENELCNTYKFYLDLKKEFWSKKNLKI